MPAYLFKSFGVQLSTHTMKTEEVRFEASDDDAAIAHVNSVVVPDIQSKLFGMNSGELLNETGETIGVLDMNRLTWLRGDVPHDQRPVFAGYTRAQLQPAFDLVKDKEHWKNAIDTVVPKDVDQNLISAAVAFYTGSLASITETDDGLRVTAEGYFSAIGT